MCIRDRNEKAYDLAINAVLGKKEEKIQEVDVYKRQEMESLILVAYM